MQKLINSFLLNFKLKLNIDRIGRDETLFLLLRRTRTYAIPQGEKLVLPASRSMAE